MASVVQCGAWHSVNSNPVTKNMGLQDDENAGLLVKYPVIVYNYKYKVIIGGGVHHD